MQLNANIYPGTGIHPALVFISDESRDRILRNEFNLDKNKRFGNTPFKIIMVDDDVDDREMFTEAAAELNLNLDVICMESGRDLIGLLNNVEKRLPDVIVLDLNMPDRSGRECLDYIRSSEKLRHVPIVIYSTSSSNRDIEDTYDKGANLYIRKPSSFSDLRLIIKVIAGLNWEARKPYGS
ncbi:MAG: response regulator, partial [Bacteroidota bacterium]